MSINKTKNQQLNYSCIRINANVVPMSKNITICIPLFQRPNDVFVLMIMKQDIHRQQINEYNVVATSILRQYGRRYSQRCKDVQKATSKTVTKCIPLFQRSINVLVIHFLFANSRKLNTLILNQLRQMYLQGNRGLLMKILLLSGLSSSGNSVRSQERTL